MVITYERLYMYLINLERESSLGSLRNKLSSPFVITRYVLVRTSCLITNDLTTS